MRVGLLCMLSGAIGCNRLFNLDDTAELVDGAGPVDADPDRDDDGIPNVDDSCPDAADPGQHDEDGDGVGDACDRCPLDADSNDDTDGDGIDDVCDPHPATATDCLVLFDSFQGYADADWGRVPGSQIDPGVDEVRLRLGAGPRTGIGPIGIMGPAVMRLRFGALTIGSELRLLSRSSTGNTDDGHQCSMTDDTISLVNVVQGPPPIKSFAPLVAGAPLIIAVLHDAEQKQFSCFPTPTLSLPMSANISPLAGANGDQPMIVGLGTGTDLVLAAASFYGPRVDGASCAPAVIR